MVVLPVEGRHGLTVLYCTVLHCASAGVTRFGFAREFWGMHRDFSVRASRGIITNPDGAIPSQINKIGHFSDTEESWSSKVDATRVASSLPCTLLLFLCASVPMGSARTVAEPSSNRRTGKTVSRSALAVVMLDQGRLSCYAL
eukprot:5636871-Pyramimonas_sp.AAC.1